MCAELPPLPVALVGRDRPGRGDFLERMVAILTGQGSSIGVLTLGDDRIDPGRWGQEIEQLRHESAPGAKLSHHAARALLWNLRPHFDSCDLILIAGMADSPFPELTIDADADSDSAERAAEKLLQLLAAPARGKARDVVGAVLAGGASRRMGVDKARLPVEECGEIQPAGAEPKDPAMATADPCTWIERVYLLLAERCRSVCVSGRIVEPQGPDFPSLHRNVPSQLDLRPGCGPLGGMETMLATSGGRAVLTLPCDLPEFSARCLDCLLEGRDREAGATVFRLRDGRLESAVAVLEPRALDPLRRFLAGSERRIRFFFATISTKYLEVPAELAADFANINTPEDRRRRASR